MSPTTSAASTAAPGGAAPADDRATPPAEPAVIAPGALVVAAALAAPLALAGCGGGGGGGAPAAQPTPPATTISAITVRVTTSAPAAIRVANVAGDGAGAVRFRLGADRAADPGLHGPEHVYAFTIDVAATDPAEGTAQGWVEVRINADPLPAAVAHVDAVGRIRHLFNRACFGASAQDLARWQDVPYARIVDQLVDGCRTTAVQPPPAWRDEPIPTSAELNAMTTAQRDARDRAKGDRIHAMKAGWLREMAITPSPLTERMTLFWHSHFVTASWDLFEPQPTWRYLALLRAHALGSFAELLHAIAKDPAMCLFLDSASNVKNKPNENFARELLELFTLGEGQDYVENDIVVLARCFTGYGLTSRKIFAFNAAQHDTAAKTLFGLPVDAGGEADGDQALDLILAKDRCARFIVDKLCMEFIGSVPGDASAWAASFKAGGYEIAPLLKTILKSSAFLNAPRGGMHRSPAELHVGLWRAVELEPSEWGGEHWQLSEEDQDLLDPPNVRGWVGGGTWMTSRTLLRRREFLGWKQWDLWNRHNPRLRRILPTLLMAIDPYDTARLDPAAYPHWDRVGGPFRALLVDPAIHLK
ncbi:MAG TPA: DUF1800 domain-containing protein [Planctomycetota bacterium]|nr:DUF1800 domain-containing protein [Planctomycetota bacterium]